MGVVDQPKWEDDYRQIIYNKLRHPMRRGIRIQTHMTNLDTIHKAAITSGDAGLWKIPAVHSTKNEKLCLPFREFFDSPKHWCTDGTILISKTPRSFANTMHGTRSLSVYIPRRDYHSMDPADSRRLWGGRAPEDNLARARSPPLTGPGITPNRRIKLEPVTRIDKFPGAHF
jgi:hypothetical protein